MCGHVFFFLEALQLSGAGELELVCNKSPKTDQSQGTADTGTDETPATVAINGRYVCLLIFYIYLVAIPCTLWSCP